MPETDIAIRALEPEDWPDFVAIRSQPLNYANTMGLPHPSAAEWRKRLGNPPDGFRHLAAVVDGKVVGAAGLSVEQGRRAHVGVVGLGVHDAYAGRGIGRALMTAILDLADNWLNLKRLELVVFVDNARAIALYESLGFEREGLERAHAFRDGAYVDALAMARLRL